VFWGQSVSRMYSDRHQQLINKFNMVLLHSVYSVGVDSIKEPAVLGGRGQLSSNSINLTRG